MADRPAIPEPLRRQVLVDAGHRCAIQTCRQAADVDLHHIIPWAQCRTHEFDNLIALCPNCHRRADNGVIDREALRLYKARLAAGFGPLTKAPPTAEGEHPWVARRLDDSEETGRSFNVGLEYPSFADGAMGAVNVIEEGIATLAAAEFRQNLLNVQPVVREMPKDQLTSAFSVLCWQDGLLSIRTSSFGYTNGSAHGWQKTTTRTYLLGSRTILLELHYLFQDAAAGLQLTADYCIKSLEKELSESQPDEWIRRGAAPQWQNYRKWNLTPLGLLITFDAYEVASYGAGRQQVLIPYEVLRGCASSIPQRLMRGA